MMRGPRRSFQLRSHRWMAVLVAIMLSLAAIPGTGVHYALAAAPPVAAWDWQMPGRFGLDQNGDGVLDDIPPPLPVLFPDAWPVTLNACVSAGGDSPIVVYRWSISGPGLAGTTTVTQTTCAFVFPFPQEGAYQVQLSV